MTIMYKLVTQYWTTHGGMKWAIGKTNRATGLGTEMCSPAVLHCYSHPLLAVLFNPIHADIKDPILLEIKCSPIVNTDGLKHACKEQTPQKICEIPVLSITQRVAFAIKVDLLVQHDTVFVSWAERWLAGVDRSDAAVNAAAYAANAAYAAIAAYAVNAAAYAANAAYAAAASADQFIPIAQWVMRNIK